jgi:hypothetical protein
MKLPNDGAFAPGTLKAYLAPPQGMVETFNNTGSVIALEAAAQKLAGGESLIPRGFVLWNLTPTQCAPVISIRTARVSALFSFSI